MLNENDVNQKYNYCFFNFTIKKYINTHNYSKETDMQIIRPYIKLQI